MMHIFNSNPIEFVEFILKLLAQLFTIVLHITNTTKNVCNAHCSETLNAFKFSNSQRERERERERENV